MWPCIAAIYVTYVLLRGNIFSEIFSQISKGKLSRGIFMKILDFALQPGGL